VKDRERAGGLLLGYARISKGDEQNNALQTQALRGAGCRRLFEDAYAPDLAPVLRTSWFKVSRSGSGRRAVLYGGSSLFGRLPIPWEKFVDPLGGIVRQFGGDEGEPGVRIDLVHFVGLCRTSNYAE